MAMATPRPWDGVQVGSVAIPGLNSAGGATGATLPQSRAGVTGTADVLVLTTATITNSVLRALDAAMAQDSASMLSPLSATSTPSPLPIQPAGASVAGPQHSSGAVHDNEHTPLSSIPSAQLTALPDAHAQTKC